MSQSDLLVSSSKSTDCQLSLSWSPLPSTLRPVRVASGVMDACFPFILYVASLTKSIIFPSMHLSDFRFTVFLLFPHLVQRPSSWAGMWLPAWSIAPDSPHPQSPVPPPHTPPGHLANSCPLSLSEVLLLACSLIKNLQRPLTAYTTKSQPVCLSFRSLHCLLPLCPFHFSQSPQIIPRVGLISPLTVIHFTFILLPCCAQAVPEPKITSFVPLNPQSCPLTKHRVCIFIEK